MEIAFAPYYTINGSVLLDHDIQSNTLPDKSVKLNVVLDIPKERAASLTATLGSLENAYIVSLPAAIFSDETVLQEYLPVLYILASFDAFSFAGEIVIPVLCAQTSEQQAVNTEEIKKYFLGQGVKIVYMPLFNQHEMRLQQVGSFTYYVQDDNSSRPKTAGFTIITPVLPGMNLSTFNNHISRAQTTIATTASFHENYIERIIFDEEIKNWEKRSLLYRDFLALSKSVQEKEYYEVLNWYHKEYEALPLWYKRFGHIIKVMMGKRSFKSLFTNKFKKPTR
ncbi:MAG: hypothetical protein ABIQ88_11460 [Chitinophagaceae bacterium]